MILSTLNEGLLNLGFLSLTGNQSQEQYLPVVKRNGRKNSKSTNNFQNSRSTSHPINSSCFSFSLVVFGLFPGFNVLLSRLNSHMTLEDFKSIFWMEWAHRQLGRALGFSFAIPLAYFALRGTVRGPLAAKLSAILLGIGFQGALGWYMVKSGLEEDIDVPRVSKLFFLNPF